MKVLLTDGSFKHSLAAARALASHGIEVHTCSSHDHAISFFSKAVKKSFLVPDPDSVRPFLRAVERLHRKQAYDVILPIGDTAWDSIVLNGRSDLLAKIPSPPVSSYKIARDKAKTLAFAEKLGVGIPKTVFPKDPDSMLENLRFPVVAKPAISTGKAKIIFNEDEAKKIRRQNATSRYILQERVSGDGYGFFGLFKRGVMKTFFMHRRIREVPPTGGPSSAAEATYRPELLEMGSKILGRLDWHGVAMVEFKRDEATGEFKLIEINPKFWGTLDLAIASGIDFPYLAVQLATVCEVGTQPAYQRIRYCWPLPDDLRHLRRAPASFPSVMADWVNPLVRKNVCFSDLGPHLALVYDAGRNLIRPPRYRVLLAGEVATSGKPRSVFQLVWLRGRGIRSILDLTETVSTFESSFSKLGGDYLNVPMVDHAPPTMNQITRSVSFITEQTRRGNPVLVHCRAGLGRAGTVAACYLVAKRRKSARGAIDEVRSWRPGAIEQAQEASVKLYAKTLKLNR